MSTVTPIAPENFAAELVRRGLPVDYAQHFAAELDDHRRDLLGELRASGFDKCAAEIEAARRLGDDRLLAKRTVREFRQRHWCGRWPLVTFVLAPIPALCLFWLAMATVLMGVTFMCQTLGIELTQIDGKTSLFERSLVESIWGVAFLLGPVFITSLFWKLARHSGMALFWGVLVGVQIASFIGLMQFNVDYQRCTLQVGMPIDLPSLSGWIHWYFGGTWRHLVQVIVPLALGMSCVASQMMARWRALSKIAC